MRRIVTVGSFFAGLFFAGIVIGGQNAASSLLLQDGWRFSKDASAELEAQSVAFDDTAWQQVSVPHDWAIYGPFDPNASGGTGKLPWKGVGWYRRSLFLPLSAKGSCVFLDFDGVMASPKVFVNGKEAGGWDYGYMGFRVDATPFVQFGKENVLAVRADTRNHHSRWYPGAGIYRKVVMKLENPAHFAYHSVFVSTPSVSANEAKVKVDWKTESAPAGAKVSVSVRREEKEIVSGSVAAGNESLTVTVARPALWDVDAPNLYWAEVRLMDEKGKTLAKENVRFGIRSIAFPVGEGPFANDVEKNGFHLNGRRVQLRGVNLHSDLGLLGMAFNRFAMRRQLEIMKDMGVNALRTSHNPPAPEVLDLCDEMGIVVWDECFDKWDGTAGRTEKDNLEDYVSRNLRAFIKRDRNHPCVIIWSISNEIWIGDPANPANPGLTKARCSLFRKVVLGLDTTRPVGNGNISSMNNGKVMAAGVFDDLDITGWNYHASYRPVKQKYPGKPIVYSESASALSSYGFYNNPPPQSKHDYARKYFQVDSYDHNAGPDISDVEFDFMKKDRYVCGEFVWTGIDYIGEPTPYWKESRSSYFGAVDLTGIPKDRFYLYRSYWNPDAVTVHLLPHWNWAGKEGKNVPVYVYTSGDSAELFLNGVSQGMRRKGEPQKQLVNLAAGARVTASSQEENKKHFAACADDGNPWTRWCASSKKLPQWLQLDFPHPITFRSVFLCFENDVGGYAYELQFSEDGKTWTTQFTKKLYEEKCAVFDKPVTVSHARILVTEALYFFWASISEVYFTEQYTPALAPYYNVCDTYRLRWLDVPYTPGEVKTVAYKDGKKIGEAVMRTAGAPVALSLTVEPPRTTAAEELIWVQVDALDAKGVRNPLATDRVFFSLSGEGKILGVGNGNAHEFEAFTNTESHPMYAGKVVAVIRRNKRGTPLTLTVSAKGMASASVKL